VVFVGGVLEVVLYSRVEHGGHRVERKANGFEVHWPGGVVCYPTARKLLVALVNQEPNPSPNAKDWHLTFDRYFRQGKYTRESYPQEDTLSMFSGLAISKKSSGVTPTGLIVHVPLGIDLKNRGHEVAKLFYAGFGNTARRKGWDTQDVLQEVYKALLVRNKGKCPWDPRKSSFGHYVHMVCRGVMSNYARKYNRIYNAESYGSKTASGEIVDVADSSIPQCDGGLGEVENFSRRNALTRFIYERATVEGVDLKLLGPCLNMISEGHTQKEISKTLGVGSDKVSTVVRFIRAQAHEWRA